MGAPGMRRYPWSTGNGGSSVRADWILGTVLALASWGSGWAQEIAPPQVTFAHFLSDFDGPVVLEESRIAIDPESKEVVTAYGRVVHVFNTSGMEVHKFSVPMNLGAVIGVAADGDGHIYSLAYDLEAPGDRPRWVLTRHDFRGVPKGEVALSGAPPEFDRIRPNRVVLIDDKFFLCSTLEMLVTVMNKDGSFVRGYDLARILEFSDKVGSMELNGFSVDAEGNLLATAATVFRGWVISPEGKLLLEFGKSGSVPGTFGNCSGIARDADRRLWVADKNRAVVVVFDSRGKFLFEADGDGRLGGAADVVLDGAGRAYVSRAGRSPVAVLEIRPAPIN